MYRRIGIAAALLFVAMQLVPVQHTNPPVNPAVTLERSASLPDNVKTILQRSCKDCHSHETRWPAYSYVAPISWLLVHDVDDARENLNFSEWSERDADARRDSLIEICRRVRRGQMPLKSYTWMHPSAKLTAEDVKTLCDWTVEMRRSLRGN